MDPVDLENLLKCVLGFKQCNPGLHGWTPGPFGTAATLLLPFLVFVLNRIWKSIWDESVFPLIKGNARWLFVLGVLATGLALGANLSVLLGGLALLLTYFWIDRRSQLPNAPAWMQSPGFQPAAVILLAAGLAGLIFIDDWLEDREQSSVLQQADKYQVTFLLPTRDASGALLSAANAQVSSQLSKQLFAEIHYVLRRVLQDIQGIELLPEDPKSQDLDELREHADRFGDVFAVLVQRTGASRTPIDTVVATSFRTNYDSDRPQLVLSVSLHEMDGARASLKAVAWPYTQIEAYDNELRRIALLSSHRLIDYLFNERMRDLSDDLKTRVRENLVDQFREYAQADGDPYRAQREGIQEINDRLVSTDPCSECLDPIVDVYRDLPPRDPVDHLETAISAMRLAAGR